MLAYLKPELGERIKILKDRLKCCVVCPHHCKVDRINNERGFCRAGADMVIDGYGPHYGEEALSISLLQNITLRTSPIPFRNFQEE